MTSHKATVGHKWKQPPKIKTDWQDRPGFWDGFGKRNCINTTIWQYQWWTRAQQLRSDETGPVGTKHKNHIKSRKGHYCCMQAREDREVNQNDWEKRDKITRVE
jgi:hypothetical protein